MKAEVNSRSSPTSYTHSLQQLIGCGELFSTRHKKTPEVAKLFHSQAQEGEKKSIKVEWKVWGEKKIDLTVWKITNLYSLRSEKYCRAGHSWGQFTAEVTERKSSSGSCLWCLFSEVCPLTLLSFRGSPVLWQVYIQNWTQEMHFP